MEKLDKWWSSLTVTEKERIASKIKGEKVSYPASSAVWEELDEEIKIKIFVHCTDAHGLLIEDWKDGKPYGD